MVMRVRRVKKVYMVKGLMSIGRVKKVERVSS